MCQTTLALKVTCLRVCLFSLDKYGRDAAKDRQSESAESVCMCVFVSLSCLPQRPKVRVKEVLHLASINRSALFISQFTNIGYLFQHRPSTLLPCSTLKPDSNTHRLLNQPHPSRSFPFGPLYSIEIHQISTSLRPHPGPE